MIRQKVEIRFEKSEAVRFISHHDLMRAFQRAVRRADLPVRLTEGFNPRPRIVFPLALEVGIASLDEVAELELDEWIPTSTLMDRLAPHMPPGLIVRKILERPPTRKGRQPLRLRYRLHLAEAGLTPDPARLEAWRAAESLPYRRPRPPRGRRKAEPPRTIDLKAFLGAAALDPAGDLVVDVQPTAQGLARPLELLSLLLERPLEELKGVRVTKLETILSEPKDPAPGPPPQTGKETGAKTETAES